MSPADRAELERYFTEIQGALRGRSTLSSQRLCQINAAQARVRGVCKERSQPSARLRRLFEELRAVLPPELNAALGPDDFLVLFPVLFPILEFLNEPGSLGRLAQVNRGLSEVLGEKDGVDGIVEVYAEILARASQMAPPNNQASGGVRPEARAGFAPRFPHGRLEGQRLIDVRRYGEQVSALDQSLLLSAYYRCHHLVPRCGVHSSPRALRSPSRTRTLRKLDVADDFFGAPMRPSLRVPLDVIGFLTGEPWISLVATNLYAQSSWHVALPKVLVFFSWVALELQRLVRPLTFDGNRSPDPIASTPDLLSLLRGATCLYLVHITYFCFRAGFRLSVRSRTERSAILIGDVLVECPRLTSVVCGNLHPSERLDTLSARRRLLTLHVMGRSRNPLIDRRLPAT